MRIIFRTFILFLVTVSGVQPVLAQVSDSNVDAVQVLIAPEEATQSKSTALEIVEEALELPDIQYDIQREVTDTVFLTTINAADFQELQNDPSILVQKNEYRRLFTSSDTLSLIGANTVHALPNGTGSEYATAIIDSGIRGTHDFFTTLGTVFDASTNPSRVILEYCQSGGLPIVDGFGNYILDGLGHRLYQGISMCSGNESSPTIINGFTYYSNTIVATTASSPAASAPCLGEYPGFDTDCRHGSHVAGIAAGTAASYSGTAYSGIAPASPIISFNIFTKYTDASVCGSGDPCLAATDADILSALSQLENLVVEGEKVGSVNLSLGGAAYANQSQCDQNNILYYYAFQRLRTLGVPVIVAAGNNGYVNGISSPGCVSTAYSVGATTITSPGVDQIASYSNIASFIDYLAPGTLLTSANSDTASGFFSLSGTSMATPIVAGAFTVLRSLFDGTHAPYPYRSLDAIAHALTTTGLPLDDVRPGGVIDAIPRIRMDAAVTQLANMPYITLPNQSTVNISYPLAYAFEVSSGDDIEAQDIIIDPSSTVTTDDFSCTPASSSFYDCDITILSDGNLRLSVTDTNNQSYTTPAQTFSSIPIVSNITTTTASGSYSTGTVIPINATITGTDSALRVGSRFSALLNNGVSVTLTATNSSSNTLTGSYTIGSLGSGQDTSKLQVVSISSVVLTELDGTIYGNAAFNPSVVGANLDQSGKVIIIDVTAPTIISAVLSGGSPTITTGNTITLTLTTNKAISSTTITINNAASNINHINATTVQATRVVQPSETGSVVFSARVTDQFGNNSGVVTTTTDNSSLIMESIPTTVSSSGGGGGGGGAATPAALPVADKLSFCSAELTNTLTEGTSSTQVLYVETALQIAGFFGSLPNLDYNSGTTAAVKSFQARYSPSHITGVVDAQTWKLLQFYGGCGTNDNKKVPAATSALQKSIAPTTYPDLKKTLRSGDRSPAVATTRTLLAKLGYLKPVKKPSSLLNSSLAKSIKTFQKQNKLTATGRIDQKTYALLIKLVK